MSEWYVKPKYSRTKVDNAGKILVSPDLYSIGDVESAQVILTNWRAAHAYPVNTFQATLRYRLKKIGLRATVAQRLKRTPSIIGKLRLKDGMKLSRMQDIGGLRAVVDSIPNVRAIEKQYRDARFTHELIDWDDYIDAPKSDGYRSLHLIYKYKNDRAEEFDNLRLELQIRTRHQHAWATAVETMSTYLGAALKSGEGDEKWKEFFRVSANALSHFEKAPPVPGYELLDRTESLSLLRDIEDDVSILGQLKGYSIATDHITAGGKGEYHLVILDSLKKAVSIRSYPESKFDLAADDYSAVEELPLYGHGIEAVLVSVSSIRALKAAYPNYFLDTHEFVNHIEKLISEAKRNNRNDSSYKNKLISHSVSERVEAEVHGFGTVNVTSKDVPQAESLESIRLVLAAIKQGAKSKSEISGYCNMSLRHVNYRLTAAWILGCVDGDNITASGNAWLRRNSGTLEEAEFLKSLIEGSLVYKEIVPDLFDYPGPSRAAIAKRLSDKTGMSATTADRRAATLLSWGTKLKQGFLVTK